MPERKPARALGEMTRVATCPPPPFPQQPALLEPSSQVMKRTPPLRKAAEAVIVGTTVRSQLSPVETPQSWVSLHMLGVIHTKFGTWPLLMSPPNSVNGTTWAAQRAARVRISLYCMNGLCFIA